MKLNIQLEQGGEREVKDIETIQLTTSRGVRYRITYNEHFGGLRINKFKVSNKGTDTISIIPEVSNVIIIQ